MWKYGHHHVWVSTGNEEHSACRRKWAEVIALPTGIPEDLSPIVQIIPAQQLAHTLSVSRGKDPDAPRALLKVTETH